jgi:hypothetical protein
VERARGLSQYFLPRKNNDPVLGSVARQLDFIAQVLKEGRDPTPDERRSINMGFLMLRRWEEIRDGIPFWQFQQLISLLNLYFARWPSDRLAADPTNDKKIDWYNDI